MSPDIVNGHHNLRSSRTHRYRLQKQQSIPTPCEPTSQSEQGGDRIQGQKKNQPQPLHPGQKTDTRIRRLVNSITRGGWRKGGQCGLPAPGNGDGTLSPGKLLRISPGPAAAVVGPLKKLMNRGHRWLRQYVFEERFWSTRSRKAAIIRRCRSGTYCETNDNLRRTCAVHGRSVSRAARTTRPNVSGPSPAGRGPGAMSPKGPG